MKLDIKNQGIKRIKIEGYVLTVYGKETFSCCIKGLTELNCSDNELIELPELPETLLILECSDNYLETLPRLPKSLEKLWCENNRIESLPELPKSLKTMICKNNLIKKLPTIPKSLKVLSCSVNKLKSLPILPNSLKTLICYNNRLLTLKLPDSIENLSCAENPLIFIAPLHVRPVFCVVPSWLKDNHHPNNYFCYWRQYSVYKYLITFLTLKLNTTPVITTNDLWLFWKK